MPMSTKERASLAGRASQAKLSPEQRREQMRKVRRQASFNDIVAAKVGEAPPLTPDQEATLSTLFGGAKR